MSPRVLSREAARTQHEQRRTATLVADPVPGSADQAHPYFDRPATPQERIRVFAAGVELVRQWLPESRGPATDRADAERVVGRLLDYLDSVAGASYQQRWMSCGADAAGKDWLPPYASGPSKRLGARQALNALLVLGRYPAQHRVAPGVQTGALLAGLDRAPRQRLLGSVVRDLPAGEGERAGGVEWLRHADPHLHPPRHRP